MKTIAAISTPHGRGAISIVRMSGKDALIIAKKLFTVKGREWNPTPNYLELGSFVRGCIMDKCMAVFFKGPKSYTGEDTVEFHIHGGRRLAQEVLIALIEEGAAAADKGDFSKRAFINGKMSLADAEGVLDMINAESTAQINAGYRQLSVLKNSLSVASDALLNVISGLEASLDYPDELEDDMRERARNNLEGIQITVKDLLATAHQGRYIRNGINIAIIGEPNIGKSSLLNALIGRERAIVTEIAGTTRDTLEEKYEIGGYSACLIDTAGIRASSDKIERIGVELAKKAAEGADIVLLVLDASRVMTDEEHRLQEEYAHKKTLKVYNKCDLGTSVVNEDGITVSAKFKTNLDALEKAILSMVIDGRVDECGAVLTNARHIGAIAKALDCIKSARINIDDSPIECILVDLHTAYDSLGEVTGNTASEDVIDRIFATFCLGK